MSRWRKASPRRRTPQVIAACVALLLLSGCVKYQEEWTFARNGSGTLRIMCEPSKQWMDRHQEDHWRATANLFIPAYPALSQTCARAGLTIQQCKYETVGGRPHIDIVIAFPSLRNVARCPLFADRTIQWQQSRFSASVLYVLRAYPEHLSYLRGTLLDKEWFSDGTIEVRMVFPGRVLRADGAQRDGCAVVATHSFDKLAQGANLSIYVMARTGYPWLWVTLGVLVVAGTGGWFAVRLWRRRHPPAPREWQPGQIKIETHC